MLIIFFFLLVGLSQTPPIFAVKASKEELQKRDSAASGIGLTYNPLTERLETIQIETAKLKDSLSKLKREAKNKSSYLVANKMVATIDTINGVDKINLNSTFLNSGNSPIFDLTLVATPCFLIKGQFHKVTGLENKYLKSSPIAPGGSFPVQLTIDTKRKLSMGDTILVHFRFNYNSKPSQPMNYLYSPQFGEFEELSTKLDRKFNMFLKRTNNY